jgi:hypothetical protein
MPFWIRLTEYFKERRAMPYGLHTSLRVKQHSRLAFLPEAIF